MCTGYTTRSVRDIQTALSSRTPEVFKGWLGETRRLLPVAPAASLDAARSSAARRRIFGRGVRPSSARPRAHGDLGAPSRTPSRWWALILARARSCSDRRSSARRDARPPSPSPEPGSRKRRGNVGRLPHPRARGRGFVRARVQGASQVHGPDHRHEVHREARQDGEGHQVLAPGDRDSPRAEARQHHRHGGFVRDQG